MNANFPLGVILLDYTLGAAMWTLIGRFGMSICLPAPSSFVFMRLFVGVGALGGRRLAAVGVI